MRALVWRVVNELAGGQHGVVTRAQLMAAGVTGDVVDGCLRRGELRALHAGVFQAGPVGGVRMREMAAALACDGVVSRWSAAVLRELALPGPIAPVDIAIEHRRRIRRPGISIHRCTLPPGDVASVDGVPVLTLPRTLLEVAAVATPRQLERALAAAECIDSNVRRQLTRLMDRYPAKRGTRILRAVLRRGSPALTRSEAEEALLRLIRSTGLSEPKLNVRLHGYEVDCYWPEARLVVEVDGYAWHGSQTAFQNDRDRDAALAGAGIQVLRLGWHQVTRDRHRTLVQLATILARNTAR